MVRWAQETERPDGGRVIDQPWVQQNLARFQANLEVLKLMNWKQAWDITQGGLHPAEASAVKVFGSEFDVEGYHLLMEVLGEAGTDPRRLARRGAARAHRAHATARC